MCVSRGRGVVGKSLSVAISTPIGRRAMGKLLSVDISTPIGWRAMGKSLFVGLIGQGARPCLPGQSPGLRRWKSPPTYVAECTWAMASVCEVKEICCKRISAAHTCNSR